MVYAVRMFAVPCLLVIAVPVVARVAHESGAMQPIAVIAPLNVRDVRENLLEVGEVLLGEVGDECFAIGTEELL